MSDGSLFSAQPLPLGGGSSRPTDWSGAGPSRLPLAGASLSARSGTCSSALSTARSGLDTPETSRTERAYTGSPRYCSGTPRDAQRLALGERPPDSDRRLEGFGDGPQTARSSVFSSGTEAWPMTPSSAGDALSSSRSRADSLSLLAEDGMGYSIGSSAAETASYHMDLQKSLEVMRFVIMKENQKLKELLQQSSSNLGDLRTRVDAADAAPDIPHASSSTSHDREPARIEWQLRNVADALGLGQRDSDASKEAHRAYRSHAIRLPEFAGTDFSLLFFPRSPSASSTPPLSCTASADECGTRSQCELVLEISTASPCIDFKVTLSVTIDGEQQTATTVLSGCGRTSCIHQWPSGWPSCTNSKAADSVVVCEAEIEELSWGDGEIILDSSWEPPS